MAGARAGPSRGGPRPDVRAARRRRAAWLGASVAVLSLAAGAVALQRAGDDARVGVRETRPVPQLSPVGAEVTRPVPSAAPVDVSFSRRPSPLTPGRTPLRAGDLPAAVGRWERVGFGDAFLHYARPGTLGRIELVPLGPGATLQELGPELMDGVALDGGRAVCGSMGGRPLCLVQAGALGVMQVTPSSGVPPGALWEFTGTFARAVN